MEGCVGGDQRFLSAFGGSLLAVGTRTSPIAKGPFDQAVVLRKTNHLHRQSYRLGASVVFMGPFAACTFQDYVLNARLTFISVRLIHHCTRAGKSCDGARRGGLKHLAGISWRGKDMVQFDDMADAGLTPGTGPRSQLRSGESVALSREARFADIFRQQTQGFVIHDVRGRVIEANPAAEKILGRSRAELLGTSGFHPSWRPFHPDGADFNEDEYPATIALRTGKTARGRQIGVFNRINGERRWLLVDAIPQFSGSDRSPSEVFVYFTDITQQRRAAELVHEDLRNQLAHVQRTELLGTLAGGIVHDLNNTLVPIIALSSDLLSRAADDSVTRESLELICKCGGQARDLVRRILMLSRRDKPNKEQVDLCELVAEEIRLLRSTLPANVAIHEHYRSSPMIWADRAQLNQIVVNLIVNAAQAIGENKGEVTVEIVTQRNDIRTSVGLSVSDTGCGMDEVTRLRAFEPFFTTKSADEGTGLGLSVVHSIVRNHGGTIAIESSRGKGTRFNIQFPAHDGALSGSFT
jgi:PAS domain S-box-containing protein